MRQRMFAYYKGNPDITGMGQKLNAMRIVCAFLERTCKAEVKDGKKIVVITMPDVTGDAIWMKENVMREGDIVGITDRQETRDAKVEQMTAKYDGAREGKKYAGTSMLKYWLEHFYMQYDEWGPDDA